MPRQRKQEENSTNQASTSTPQCSSTRVPINQGPIAGKVPRQGLLAKLRGRTTRCNFIPIPQPEENEESESETSEESAPKALKQPRAITNTAMISNMTAKNKPSDHEETRIIEEMLSLPDPSDILTDELLIVTEEDHDSLVPNILTDPPAVTVEVETSSDNHAAATEKSTKTPTKKPKTKRKPEDESDDLFECSRRKPKRKAHREATQKIRQTRIDDNKASKNERTEDQLKRKQKRRESKDDEPEIPEGEYEVEEIVAYRRIRVESKNKEGIVTRTEIERDYRIKWANCSIAENKWIPEYNLNCPQKLAEFFIKLNRQDLAEQAQVQSESKRKCMACGVKVCDTKSLWRHRTFSCKNLKQRNDPHICDICGKEYKTKDSYRKHRKIRHEIFDIPSGNFLTEIELPTVSTILDEVVGAESS